jgi:hypothetical protein
MLLRKPYNKDRIEEAMNAAMAARLAAGASHAGIQERVAPAATSDDAKRMPSI